MERYTEQNMDGRNKNSVYKIWKSFEWDDDTATGSEEMESRCEKGSVMYTPIQS